VNVLNDMGDTPLHRAAFTGRKVKCFLSLSHRIVKEILAITSLQKDVFTVSKNDLSVLVQCVQKE